MDREEYRNSDADSQIEQHIERIVGNTVGFPRFDPLNPPNANVQEQQRRHWGDDVDDAGDINYNDDPNRTENLRRYSIGHGALAVFGADFMIDNVLKKLQFMEDISIAGDTCKVVSAGGGSGTDLIGFCARLNREYNMNFIITNVEGYENWEIDFNNLIAEARRPEMPQGDLRNLVENENTLFRFAAQDIIENPEIPAIQEADIILIQKVLSLLDERDKQYFLKNVFESAKPGAIIIIIDTFIFWLNQRPNLLHRYGIQSFNSSITNGSFLPSSVETIPRSTFDLFLYWKE